MKLNDVIYGFKLINIKNIEDINSEMYEFVHLKSGGHLAWLKNQDDNKCFGYSFRTLPEDSTGICHIIEHSLLCGSDKYPLKEPFVNLLKTSLNTFLNAMTASDFTTYPICSINDKDFNNLMDVYLDACLNPLSVKDKKPFLQEGWHYELFNKDDCINLKGVVYNEMKGAMSGAQNIIEETAHELLFAGSGYGVNSGGDPKDIPNLTYEYYCNFYKNHYHPANGLLYLYGNLDIEEKLSLISPYLDKYDYQEFKPIETPKANIVDNFEKEYQVGEGEELADNYYYALDFGMSHYESQKDALGLSILNKVLFDTNDSPVTKKIIEKNLGKDIYSYNDDDCPILSSMIVLCNSKENKLDEFYNTFMDVLKEQVKNRVDRKSLYAIINSMEYASREKNLVRNGLYHLFKLTQNFIYGYPLEYGFNIKELSKEIHDEIENDYFEHLIEKYYLNSKHYVKVTLKPTFDADKKYNDALKEKLNEYKNSLSEEQVDELIKLNEDLLAYQSKPDSKEDLAKLPVLDIKDINPEVKLLNTEIKEEQGIKYIFHELNTSNLTYVSIYSDLKEFNVEELQYVSLLKKLYLSLDTKNYSLLDLNNELKTYIGKLNFADFDYLDKDNNYHLKNVLNVSVLDENIKEMPRIVNEVLYNTIFDKEKIKVLLDQFVVGAYEGILRSGDRIAQVKIASSLSESGYITNLTYGYDYYLFLKDLLANIDNIDISAKLEGIAKRLFNLNNLEVSVSGSREAINNFKNLFNEFKFNKYEINDNLKIELAKKENGALVVPANINFVGQGINMTDYGYKKNGILNLCLHILTYDYLWSEIRVKGGAYGVRPKISDDNTLVITTYRDPNVKNSYLTYDSIAKYLEELNLEDFNSYVIGAMSKYQDANPLYKTISAEDSAMISGITKEMREEIRKETMNAKLEDVKELAKLFNILAKDGVKYTIGNADKIKECFNEEEIMKL